jgi:hypothetical protein
VGHRYRKSPRISSDGGTDQGVEIVIGTIKLQADHAQLY